MNCAGAEAQAHGKVAGRVGTVLSQNRKRQYFQVNPEAIRIDVVVAGEFATCCGVNLAVSMWGLGWGLGAGGSVAVFPAGGHAFFQDAVVLDDFDAGGFGPAGRFVVDDAFLEPEVGDFEADDVFDDCGDEGGSAEDVDEVDVRVRGHGGIEGGAGFFAESRVDGGVDGDDAVSLGLHEAGDAEGGAAFAIGEADDGDGAGVGEDFGYGGGFVHGVRAQGTGKA